MKPTQQAYDELQQAYDFFNEALFNNELPACLITFQREKRTCGYFSRNRFVDASGTSVDEIAMNPAYFSVVPPEENMQTLVHEMCHLWQHHFGTPGRGKYHNKEWADKMESIGLMPSDTGKPGGKRTGDSMADYAIEGGLFMEHYNQLMEQNFRITWMDRLPARDRLIAAMEDGSIGEYSEILEAMGISMDSLESEATKPNKSNRVKYCCPSCEVNAWGKPDLNIVCGDCSIPFVPAP